jgi:hypothetical protein
MRTMRVAFMSILVAGIAGCGFVDSQLARPEGGGDSKLEAEVKVAKPFIPVPWDQLAVGAATLIASIYGAFRAHRADVQTDKNGNGIPDDKEAPKA